MTLDARNYLGQTKTQEPVSSTSRRGARAAYHDEYPRDFGPRIAYTVSLVSDTSQPPTLCRPPIRQGGREMSAPRPYLIPRSHSVTGNVRSGKVRFRACSVPARPEIPAFLSLRMFVIAVVISGDFAE